jgi:CheY-like chemotaxis protein
MSGLPEEAGFAGTYCKTTCEECPYYQEIFSRPKKVLVVTDSIQLQERLRKQSKGSKLELEFASCEYECSAVVNRFKPDFVVLDCSLPDDTCTDLRAHIAGDPRVPGVQIILANADDKRSQPLVEDGDLDQLPQTFSLLELEQRIARGRPRRGVPLADVKP